jgi:hypothetical protein
MAGRPTGPLGDHAGSHHPAVGLLQGPLICFGSASPVPGGPPDLGLSVPPVVLQWMAIQLWLRGVLPAIEGDDPADHEVESFLTHARRSVMKDRISKKDQRKKDNYHNDGSLAELGALGTKRKEPTGCDSIIEMHEAESFRIPNSFKTIPMGSAHSPAAIHGHQLAQVHSKNEQSTIDLLVCHLMYVAGNQRQQELRPGHTLRGEEGFQGEMALADGGLERPLYPDVGQELAREGAPNAPGYTESEESGSYVNQPLGHP